MQIRSGNVFFVQSGQINRYSSGGTLLQTLHTGRGWLTTGLTFFGNGNLYVSEFSAPAASQFDQSETSLGGSSTGYTGGTESTARDSAKGFYEPSVEALFFGCLAALAVIKLGVRIWNSRSSS
jgi:hypothetical protein